MCIRDRRVPHRPPGKLQYFLNGPGSFPGREAGSVWETHNTIAESTSRMAVGTVIYGRSGDAVLRIRNTHGDSTSRPVAGPVIYGIFGDAACGIGDTHEDSTPRAAKRPTLSRNRSLVRRFCRVLSVRWGARASGLRAARRFCPVGPQNHGTSESQVDSFGGSVALSKIPRFAVIFCKGSRAKSTFSVGILNTLEKVRSRIAKVTCFTVENGPPS